MNSTTIQLITEINQLHGANVTNAQKTAENAVTIGIRLHQLKESVDHGEFTPLLEKECPDITDRCCRNYMRLATERLVEHRARALLAAPVTPEKPSMGKTENVSVLQNPQENEGSDQQKTQNPSDPLVPALPENALPAATYDQARAEVDKLNWLELPNLQLKALTTGLSGKDLSELYRNYGVIRDKEVRVYHPPKQLTPDELIAAENAQAEALVAEAERAMSVVYNDLQSKTGTLTTRIEPKRWKEFLRLAIGLNKAIRPLTKRKTSKAEKSADKKASKAAKAAATPVAKALPAPTPKASLIPAQGETLGKSSARQLSPVRATHTSHSSHNSQLSQNPPPSGLKRAVIACDKCGCDSGPSLPIVRCRTCGHYFCCDCSGNHECAADRRPAGSPPAFHSPVLTSARKAATPAA